ncbi:hypothetical protein K439DRAFT_1658965 [Ramaria rubella]|nr:hypothetical protein K439DRAFT_1658965 [Ramaria rubella]
MSLWAQKAWKYVDGTCQKPTDTTLLPPWMEANNQIVGALSGIVDASLQRELDLITEAEKAWKKLKEKTQSTGIIAKLESMQLAIRNRFSSDIPFSTTITEIHNALTTVFDDLPPTVDDWLTVLLLNALSDGPYDWLQKDLITFMTNSKVQLSVKDIVERIETEAREVQGTAKREDAALATRYAKGKAPKKLKSKCGTCQRPATRRRHAGRGICQRPPIGLKRKEREETT